MQFTHRLFHSLIQSCALAFVLIGSNLSQVPALAAPAVKLIPLPYHLGGIAVNSRTNRIYISNASNSRNYGGLLTLDGRTNMVIDTNSGAINDGLNPGNNVTVDEAYNRIYDAGVGNQTAVYDGATNAFLRFIEGGSQKVAINPSTNRIYAASSNLAGHPPPNLLVLDANTYDFIASIENVSPPSATVGGAEDVAVNPVTNKVYVVNGAQTIVVDGQTNRIVTAIDAVSARTDNVAVNASTNRIYVAGYQAMNVIDGQTNKVIASVNFGDDVSGIAVNPTLNHIYVTLSHQLKVISGVTNSIIMSVPLGMSGPLDDVVTQSVAANPATGLVYVTNLDAANNGDINGVLAVFDDSLPYPPDTTPPQIAITTPANNAKVGSLPVISGRASDNVGGRGLSRLLVFLRRVSDGAYWDGSKWVAQPVSLNATFNGDTWAVQQNLPPSSELTEGGYRVLAVAYDGRNNRADATSSFKIDKTAPQVSFTFPKAGATLTNLSYVAGRIVDNTTAADRVLLYLRRLSDGSYWTGNAWSQQPVALTTSVSGNVWARRGGLPNASQLGSDSYRLIALATDPADNHGSATIAITTRNGG